MARHARSLQITDKSYAFFRFIDLLFLIIGFFVVKFVYGVPFSDEYAVLLFAVLTAFLYLSNSFDMYKPLRAGLFLRRVLLVAGIILATFLMVISVLFFLKEGEFFSRFVLGSWMLWSLIMLLGWRLCWRSYKRFMRKRGKLLKRIAIIGLNESGAKLYQQIVTHPELGLKCVGFFDDRTTERLEGDLSWYKGTVAKAISMAQQNEIDQVYICLPLAAEKRIADIIRTLGDTTIDVFMVPEFLIKNLMQGTIGQVGPIDTISVFESPSAGIKDFYKRLFDLVFSSAALIGLLPILLGIAIAIKTTSKGPVLFRQDRYGLDGKKIGVYKFRSMKVMENDAVVKQATKNDSRITPVGAFLRRTSLDELPQFFNVLMGDMSVVGPRPHAVAHNEEYRKQVDYYMLRHKVKPGITGWAQVNGWRGETDTLEKMAMRVQYDLDYIRHWSLWFDIKIIFLTIFKGFINKNAY